MAIVLSRPRLDDDAILIDGDVVYLVNSEYAPKVEVDPRKKAFADRIAAEIWKRWSSKRPNINWIPERRASQAVQEIHHTPVNRTE